MGLVEKHNVLSGFRVCEAMRRQVLSLNSSDTIERAILTLFKYKVNAVLLTNDHGEPVGVVSKTDIMSAYYAGIEIEHELATISHSTPITCTETDPLEVAMEKMRESRVYRLYVYDSGKSEIVGLLAYPDIVGLLYRLCSNCTRNYLLRPDLDQETDGLRRFRVKEVMTPHVQSYAVHDNLYSLMEGLSQYRFGAVLIRDQAGKPVGVVSKTDLIMAYKAGLDPHRPAGDIISPAVHGCDAQSYLAEAIQQMIFSDVHRLFVHEDGPTNIVGVLSFTDAARIRSGSCRACLTSRIKIEEQAS